jgi:methionyl-tRNA formyltransferase
MLRIAFMGTPEFSVPSLSHLCSQGYQPVCVITAPDKPAGRNLKLQSSPVGKFAEQHLIPVLKPVNLKAPEFLTELRSYRPDLIVVIAFRKLPQAVWSMPPKGTFNLHASWLPQYRGAAPINRAIMNGEAETGLTTFFLNGEIDTGKIIFREKHSIGLTETAGELHNRLSLAGASLVWRTIQAIETGNYALQDQEKTDELKLAPKIFTPDCEINWNNPSRKIYNQIRGLSPHPGAFTIFENRKLKIFSSEIIAEPPTGKAGDVETDGKSYLRFATADGFISIQELQWEGRRRMKTTEFLRGYAH